MATTDAGLVAYLGEGVVLHDKRTAALLATMLLDPQVTSASCAIISSFRHGKSWRPTLLDEGHLPVDTRLTLAGVRPSPAEMIWRATYAVSSPSSHLWVARTDCVRRWIGNEKTGDELHLLTSNITASVEFRGKGQGKHCPIPIRPASEDRSIRLQALVG